MTAPSSSYWPENPNPGWNQQPPARPSKPRGPFIALAALALIVVIGIILALITKPSASGSASAHGTDGGSTAIASAGEIQAGDCVYLTLTGGPAAHKDNCGGPLAALKVNKVISTSEQCPEGYSKYGLQSASTDGKHLYCSSLYLSEGDCIDISHSGNNLGATKALTCNVYTSGGTTATFKVAKIESASSPDSACQDVTGSKPPYYYDSPDSGKYACLVQSVPKNGS